MNTLHFFLCLAVIPALTMVEPNVNFSRVLQKEPLYQSICHQLCFLLILNPVFQVPSTVILLLLIQSQEHQWPKFSFREGSAFPFVSIYWSQPDALIQIFAADDHTWILSCSPSFACGGFSSTHVLVSLTQSTALGRKGCYWQLCPVFPSLFKQECFTLEQDSLYRDHNLCNRTENTWNYRTDLLSWL